MHPRLVALSGPLKGQTFNLAEGDLSIGRLSSNNVHVTDIAVSRRHCVIKGEDGHFKIHDLESRNGSFVNGVPVKERLLEHGDRMEVGSSLFVFLVEEGEPPVPSNPVFFEESQILKTPVVQLRREDALYWLADEAETHSPLQSARKARDLDLLLRISTAVNSIRKLEDLQRRLLELVFEVIPAERGAILLVSEDLATFTSVFGWDTTPSSDRPVQVSRTVIRQVLQERAGMLSNSVLDGKDFGGSESLVASRISSVLAVPVLLFQKLLGAIYLDTCNPTARFDRDHLQLLTGIAAIAAIALENARHVEWLESENQRLQDEIKLEHSMVGESAPMRNVLQFVAKAAPTDATVLICGESGTGKELVARALHTNSRRADKPFVAINCAAIADTLLESELFGYEKGAFTSAFAQKKGKLEVADGGTLFLDEVSELAPALQAKLLRVLQEREFERVGGTHPLKVDVRLIAATNKDLDEAIREGRFRQDLFFRLNVVSLTVPPLRERRDDISLLATHFAKKYSRKCKGRDMGLSPEARACLAQYDWPGNVRELENAIERAVVLGSGDVIRPEDLPEDILETAPAEQTAFTRYHEAIKQAKKKLILQAAEQSAGNLTEAARRLGVHPNYLHRLVRNLDLRGELKAKA
jgi:transcriptional regulator with GAF, ATPase, and Fis domain